MSMEDAAARNRMGGHAPTSLPPATRSVMLRIWDPFVRVFHWLLVIGFAVNFFEIVRPGKYQHRVIGYIVLGLIAARLIWGLVGPRHARFIDFVRSPRRILAHLGDLLRHRDGRYLGHNPAGGAMVVTAMYLVELKSTPRDPDASAADDPPVEALHHDV